MLAAMIVIAFAMMAVGGAPTAFGLVVLGVMVAGIVGWWRLNSAIVSFLFRRDRRRNENA